MSDILAELESLLATPDPPEMKGRGHRITQETTLWESQWRCGRVLSLRGDVAGAHRAVRSGGVDSIRPTAGEERTTICR